MEHINNGENRRPDAYSIERELTIVIPAFRCASFLRAAIDSALHAKPATILIATDGGGLEEPRIGALYEREHPGRVRVLHRRRNLGVAGNVNRAVEHVTTPFFVKLDGDDVLVPGHLEAAFPIIAARPELAILAGHEMRIAANEAMNFEPGAFSPYRGDPEPRLMSGTKAFRFILAWRPNPCSSGCIYRTEAFREIGGFSSEISWGEDWEIWLRFARRWEVGYFAAPSALYRIHAQSSTAREQARGRLCYGYEAVYRRAAELCDDPEIAPVLRRSFLRVSRLYGKAAVRQALRFRAGAAGCAWGAVRTLATAVSLPRPASAGLALGRVSDRTMPRV